MEVVRAVYIPVRDVEDKLVWEHTKNDFFSVKSAYLLKFREAYRGELLRLGFEHSS